MRCWADSGGEVRCWADSGGGEVLGGRCGGVRCWADSGTEVRCWVDGVCVCEALGGWCGG